MMKYLMRLMIVLLFPMSSIIQANPFYQTVKVHRCQLVRVMGYVALPAKRYKAVIHL